jgi:putative ABC transport system permease protein
VPTLFDFRYALRLLVRNPGFSVVSGLTLALGIGASTAIFSIIDAVLLRRAPLPGVEQVAVVWETDRQTGTTREPASLPDFLDYRQRSGASKEMAAFNATEVNYAPDRGDPVRLQALAVTAEFLPLLGLSPLAGRGFTTTEASPGGPRVVIISDSFWSRALGRSPAALGARMRIDGQLATIVGIMPPGSDFGIYQILRAADYSRSFADRAARAAVDLWLPLQATPETMPRSTHPIFMIARLRDRVETARQEFASLASDLERAYPENTARGTFVEPLADIVFGPVRPALLVLLAAVSLVLLVACANVANLLLARGSARRREVAVRMALGAGARRLVAQFMAEGLLLTIVGGTLGLGVAAAGLRALVALAPADLPRIDGAAMDLRVLGVTLAVSLIAGIGFGLVPALHARRIDVQGTLKAEGAHGGSPDRARLRSALVVVEFALAVMLVIGAALLIQSFWRLAHVDAGFDAAGVVKAEYQLPSSRYPADFRRFPDFAEMHAFTHALLETVAALPGVQAAAIAGNHPIDPGFTNSFTVVGREAEARTWPEISIRRVTSGYFQTMSVPLIRGRLLSDADGTFAPPVLLVNQAAARRFFGDADPVGQRIRFWGAVRTIVGIVGNERFHGLSQAPPPAVYTPLDQTPSANGAGVLLARASGDPEALLSAIRARIRERDPALAVFGLEPLDQTLARSMAGRRFTMLVLGLLAGVALLLAAVGIHGVMSCAVTERTREIGIRVALGAQPHRVLRQVIGEGLILAAAGAAIGLAGSLALNRLLVTLLYGVTATDPLTCVAVPLVLSVVAGVASYVPARRATGVDPLVAMRQP